MSIIKQDQFLFTPSLNKVTKGNELAKTTSLGKGQVTSESLNEHLQTMSDFYRKSDFSDLSTDQSSKKSGENLSSSAASSSKEEKKAADTSRAKEKTAAQGDIERGFPGTKDVDLKNLKMSKSEQQKEFKRVKRNLTGFDKTVEGYEETSQKLKDDGLQDPPSAIELGALEIYSDGNYSTINPVLRGDKLSGFMRFLGKFGIGPQVSMAGVTKLASSGLNKLPDYKDKNVYRQISLSGEQIAQYEPGKVITEHAFTSTSKTREGAASRMGNTEFVIRSKKGKDVEAFSRHPEEKEVLFTPGTQFKVLDQQVKNVDGKDMTLIFMEEVE